MTSRKLYLALAASIVLALAIVAYARFTKPVQGPCPPGLRATQEGCR